MKIVFAGTSHGVPAADRFCSCYIIEVNGKIYMVDAGAPAAEMILRYGGNMNDFRALFTTHVHGDHTAGMVQLISLMNWYYKESSGRFFITRQNHIDATLRWLETSESGAFAYDRLHLEVPKAGVVYEDENIKAEYIPNEHMPDSYSVLITAGEKRVLFGGDFPIVSKRMIFLRWLMRRSTDLCARWRISVWLICLRILITLAQRESSLLTFSL